MYLWSKFKYPTPFGDLETGLNAAGEYVLYVQ